MIRRQIDEAVSMGIAGFAVDWNGPTHTYTDKNFEIMEKIANEKQFHVALLYNESDDPAQSTDATITSLDRAYQAYFGPDAPYRSAYMTYNNRPVVFIFPKSGKTDWNLVRQHVNSWATPPLLVYKEDSPYANVLDGFYVWVNPGKKGWEANGSAWGKDHLEDFYKRMRDKYPDKLLVAGAWPGFDDSKASWGLNRHMDTRCGKTLEETLQIAAEKILAPIQDRFCSFKPGMTTKKARPWNAARSTAAKDRFKHDVCRHFVESAHKLSFSTLAVIGTFTLSCL